MSVVLQYLDRNEIILYGIDELIVLGKILEGFIPEELAKMLNGIGFENVTFNSKNGMTSLQYLDGRKKHIHLV